MVPAYEQLFRGPLNDPTARSKTRIVIVPDGPMHGLPFAALRGARQDDYLLARGSIAVAGSTSLYLYALRRDEQFRASARPKVFVVGNPELDLQQARDEAVELGLLYDSVPLLGRDATVQNFLASAKNSTIIHFAGHGIANPQNPSLSKLRLAPHGNDSGELTAEKLMTELSELERTRLVVLAACSSAGGVTVGPEGLAPLVRPLIAANVPAVVGTLWDVNDATTRKLLVSLHCHYRNGDDVAVALQHAQLELRKTEHATTWAAFQVVGYAGSPFAHHVTMENTQSEHICTQNSFHRPDGLHPQ
jgi:CHAT domain-containing protein